MYRFCVSWSVYSLYLDINLCLTPKKLYFQNRRYKSVFSYIFLLFLKNKQKWPRTGGLNFCYFFTIYTYYNVFYYIYVRWYLLAMNYTHPDLQLNSIKWRYGPKFGHEGDVSISCLNFADDGSAVCQCCTTTKLVCSVQKPLR